MKEVLYTGLDIGSQTVKIAIAQMTSEGGMQVIGSAEKPSVGVTKGSISSIDDTVSSISSALESAERMTGRPISKATIGISGVHIGVQESKGVVAISRADGEIKENDIDRVVEAAQAVATPPNHEILHVIPLQFSVDNQKGIKDPAGMSGVRLEVQAQIVQILSLEIKNLTKAVYRTGLEINDVVLSVLACSEATLSRRQKELGVALVNIGSTTTSIAVFEEGDMLYAGVIPIGSAHITSDLAIGLRTSIDIAERVKLGVGRVSDKKMSKREVFDISEFSGKDEGSVASADVVKIIEARLEEIFDHVNDKLTSINRAGRLPAGIVLTGGGAKLPGIIEAAKNHFRLPSNLGYTVNLDSPIEKMNSLTFTTAMGLAMWDKNLYGDGASSMMGNGLGSMGGAFKFFTGKVQSIFK